MTSCNSYFRELWEGKRRGLGDKLVVALMVPGALVYSMILRLRAFLYKRGVLPSFRLGVPVISVGNLTVGGTGKTPMTVLVARLLVARGKRVAVLSRGYGGAGGTAVRIVSDGSQLLLPPSEAGDEPILLANSVPGLVVVTGSDRYRAGLVAIERFQPDVFLLDDGYQHLRLQRDLNILLLDAGRPFGNGWTLPAGLLREPLSAIRRADLIVYTRAATTSPGPALSNIPVCHSSHRLTGIVSLSTAKTSNFSDLAGKKGVACAGIADPNAFFSALTNEGLNLSATLAFRDHCHYDVAERSLIFRTMKETAADYLITTEKDAVKMTAFHASSFDTYAAVLDLEISNFSVLEQAIEKLL